MWKKFVCIGTQEYPKDGRGFMILMSKNGTLARILLYLSLTGNFTTQYDIRGVSI